MKHTSYRTPRPQGNTINLREEIGKYLRYWPWFIITITIALTVAYLHLKYTPNSYQTSASILIKDEGNSNISQLAMFQDLGISDRFSGANLNNEIEVLKSRKLTERMVRELDLNIRYFTDGRVRTLELYKKAPFKLFVVSKEEEWPNGAPDLFITPISSTEFTVEQEEVSPSTQSFGKEFEYEGLRYLVTAAEGLKENRTTRVSISSIPRTIDRYRNALQVSLRNNLSSIIAINHVSELPEKSEAIIDKLIYLFNLDAIENRDIVSRNTANFIDERLEIVWNELDSVELNKVRYKESHNMVNLQAEGSISLESASESSRRVLEARTEISQIDAMISYLETGKQSSLLPANLGISDNGLMNLIQQYNQIVMQRNQLLIHSTESHPTVVSLTTQLVTLKANVLESLRNARASLNIRLNDLVRQGQRIGGQLSQIPLKERDFTTIERQQEIKQTLYLYLLQKREETSIALAVTEPKAKIIDSAHTLVSPVSPQPNFIYLAAMLLGVIVPFGSIYFHNVLDNKIHSRKDVTSIIPNTTILAEIPEISRKEADIPVGKNDLGILAESFRVLRTNLKFAGVIDKGEIGRSIIVTSSIKGEGKTMVSVNLAMTLAHSGSKVLLIGADIRNPKLHRFIPEVKETPTRGLVEYLVYEDSSLEDYIMPSKLSENLSILHSGAIPPNPTELLMSERVSSLIDDAKSKFDYVIIDTAPTLMVTDTFLFSEYTDATLYVIRAGYTKKQIIEFAKEIKDEGKLKRVNFVLNDVSATNYGYGGKYGYGYGYTANKKSFWKR